MRLAEHKPEPRIHPALHIDVLVDGRRVADETFSSERHVSVGRARGNAIVLFDAHAPRSVPLFHRSRDGYDLRYTDEMHGQVASSPDAPYFELKQLRGAAATNGHVYDLPLTEGARGTIEVGDGTVEFELVAGSEPLIVPRAWLQRWATGTALGGVLLLGSLLVWTLSRPIKVPPRDTATPTTTAMTAAAIATAQAPTIAPPATKLTELPQLTIAAHPEQPGVATTTARRLPARRSEVAPVGVLRVGTALALPDLGQVRIPSRDNEWNVGDSDYTADGVLRPETVVRSLQQQAGAVRATYEHELRRSPAISGDLIARILINTDGRVSKVTIVKDTLPSLELSQRVAAFLRDWRAPGPTVAPAEYEVPFHFRAKGRR
jgi:hypothetical protein